jgi:hypothetical protein
MRAEGATLEQECERGFFALQEEERARARQAREVQELEVKLASSRKRRSKMEAESQLSLTEYTTEADALRAELEAQTATQRRNERHRATQESKCVELEKRLKEILHEVEISESAESQLEAELGMVLGNNEHVAEELRRAEAESNEFALEAADSERREGILSAELAEERCQAKELRHEAQTLLDQRRHASLEADEAFKRCTQALDESISSTSALEACDEELARSEHSCELMQDSLAGRFSVVHDQVQKAEQARAKAARELEGLRLEHVQLRSQLRRDNDRRKFLLAGSAA